MQVVFAEDDGAVGFQRFDTARIVRWDAAAAGRHAAGGWDTGEDDVVLETHGNAVERAQRCAAASASSYVTVM